MSISRLSLAALLLMPFAAQAQDNNAVPKQASGCISCHSADGNPLVEGVPILSGQRSDYLEAALKAYREGRRTGGPADLMRFYTKELSDEDIKEISEWFAQN
ncbi:c-type cytochrome [Nitratireductor aquimarinus]|uniref:c-type cytochrome n=1 Tax=Nitratireductor aquimarinus TaxID=889300 RepID=UPI001A908792|nr:c-type cytochrome [Nitratireductor aquimarinus]MBN8242534.1 c-type cytochrome [Nitratireductor aquimarinus]MBY6130921.1 c-type cytochrome [Nitratireductor aquimarinus]MCA1302324.1 c-type cytochrome [Nitratireductor aquimarinus]